MNSPALSRLMPPRHFDAGAPYTLEDFTWDGTGVPPVHVYDFLRLLATMIGGLAHFPKRNDPNLATWMMYFIQFLLGPQPNGCGVPEASVLAAMQRDAPGGPLALAVGIERLMLHHCPARAAKRLPAPPARPPPDPIPIPSPPAAAPPPTPTPPPAAPPPAPPPSPVATEPAVMSDPAYGSHISMEADSGDEVIIEAMRTREPARRWPWIVGGGVAVVGIGTAIYLGTRKRRRR